MRGKLVSQIALLVGALGLSGMARSQDINSGAFSSIAQAEQYLRQNPNGPLAKAAFLAIIEFQLARENPGFSRSDIAKGIALGAPVRRGAAGQQGSSSNQNGGKDLY